MSTAPRAPQVALFATCLVDLFRPTVGFAAASLLTAAGCRVEVPQEQTCCGQPTYNAGDRAGAKAVARRTIALLEPYEHVVVPSGSCAGMLKRHYPALLADETEWRGRAEALAAKTHELTGFLAGVLRAELPQARLETDATYHDGCAGLRELGTKSAPRRLLAQVQGLRLAEMDEAERCCGFGGLFCVKYDAVSEAMGSRKLDSAQAVEAPLLVSGELGCLLHLAGLAARQGRQIRCRHIAEVLAGDDATPAIGEPG